MIYTEGINVVPFEMKYLLDYYHGFNVTVQNHL